MHYLISAIRGSSRWDPARFIGYEAETYDPLNSYLIEAVTRLPKAGEYLVVDDVNRPDMICAAIYNNDMTLWWLLMIYNGLWDYSALSPYPDIPVGTTISYFSLDDLERLYFGLRARRLANPS